MTDQEKVQLVVDLLSCEREPQQAAYSNPPGKQFGLVARELLMQLLGRAPTEWEMQQVEEL